MNHAGSYTCVCPPSITGSTCEDSEWMDRYLCICLPLNVVMYLISQGYGCVEYFDYNKNYNNYDNE